MNHAYDDATESYRKALMPIDDYSLQPVVWDHAESAIYKMKPASELLAGPPYQLDARYNSNNEFWEALQFGQLRRTDINVILDSFFLFEWFPRSPGLYFTDEARYAREDAAHRVTEIRDGVIIYDPYGKMSMLQGGIGNIRLRPIDLEGGPHYFASASSNGQCHQGVPIALPESLYNRHIDEIAGRGAVTGNLIGQLKFMPERLTNLYRGYRNIPKFYLKIHEVTAPDHPESRTMEGLSVSVASSFISSYEGNKRVYATYVTFDPSQSRSLRDAARWLEDEYVIGTYRGKIVTDFDEITSHFTDAPFSLSNVMQLKLKKEELAQLELGRMFDDVIQFQTELTTTVNINHVETLHMEQNKYKITGGQQGAVGDNATAHDFTQQQIADKDIDLTALVLELAKLRGEARKEAVEPEHDIEVAKLAEAESAAKKGDKKTALEKLASAGKWTLDIATKIGTPLATSYLKAKLGL